MTVRNILDAFDEFIENDFTDSVKTTWIGDVEGRVLCDIQKKLPESVTLPKRGDDSVALHDCYMGIYLLYMSAMAKLSLGESKEYREILKDFESSLTIYAKQYIRERR